MGIRSFKDIVAWQKAHDFTTDIYSIFLTCRDYGFKDQLQRASISIMNNIAEGYARRSDKTFRQYLLIAKGSSAEVESMLLISLKLGYISAHEQQKLLSQIEEIQRLIAGFIKTLSTQDS